jgi:UPF0755 protein
MLSLENPVPKRFWPRLLLLTMLILAGGIAWFSLQMVYLSVPYRGDRQLLVIAPKTGVQAIARQLQAAGVIPSANAFVVGSVALGLNHRFQAGEYEIKPDQTGMQTAQAMANGKVYQRLFTLIEGAKSWELAAQLGAAEALVGSLATTPAEGSALPETYAYRWGENRAAVLARMQRAMDGALAQAWAQRSPQLPLKSPQELLILASIVEAETPVPAERARVAAVYYNRLKLGMKLQADPTVAYAIESKIASSAQGGAKRPLTKADLTIEDPYNTYRITGLPPGPIGNPGRASLNAAAAAVLGDELYFVASPEGGHVFAKTYAEHLKNVEHWRQSKR